MAYYIFLKSSRSLEEFRKILMSKFLLNLLQISKALVNSKIQFLIQKSFSLLSARPTLWPVWTLAQPAHWPHRPRKPKSPRPAHPARASVASSREIHFPFRFTPSRAGRLCLVSLSTGPHLSDVSSSPCRLTPASFFRPLRPPRAARPPTS
jgi:hypothetical protein